MFYSLKLVFLSSIAIFKLGSLICRVLPSSLVFIIERVVAGVSLASIFSRSVILTVYIIPLY